MKRIRFWAWLVLCASMLTAFGESVLYNTAPGWSDIFPGPNELVFNYLGIYFAVSGFILWAGQFSPVSNRQIP